MSLAATIQITDQDIQSTSASQGCEALGQIAGTSDGRTFAYALNGAAILAGGKITQAPAVVANSVSQTIGTAQTIGSTTISYTIGATAIAQDQYKGGYFVVVSGTGLGQMMRVTGNTAATAAGSYAIIVKLDRPLAVGLATTSVVSLVPNQFAGSVIMASNAAPAMPVTGAPVAAIPANAYYWSQIGGMASILSDGAITKNAGAIPSNGVDGAVEILVDATVTKIIGYAPELTVTATYSPLILTI